MAQQPSNESRGKPPISKHPLFPAIVALWFGALFGLGSMAIRPTLIESLVIASRLDTLVPSAAPPLGLTARILIGVIMAAIGGVLGAMIARRIGRDKPVERARRRGADGAKAADSDKVESVREGTGSRRRSLALSEEADEFTPYEVAPLPGGGLNILDVTTVEITPAPASAMEQPVQISPEPESEPMELTRLADEVQPAVAQMVGDPVQDHEERSFDRPFAAPEPVVSVEAPATGLGRFAAPEQSAQRAPFAPPVAETPETEAAEPEAFRPAAIELQQFQPDPAPRFAAPEQVADMAQPAPDAPFANRFTRESASPIDFSQPVFQADVSAVMPVAEPELVVAQATFAPEPAIEPAPEPAPVPLGEPFPTSLDDAAIARIAGADLDALSPVELVERLALSIQNRRKARLAASAAVIPQVATPAAPMPVEFAASPAPAPALALPEHGPSAFAAPTNTFAEPVNPVPEVYSPLPPLNSEPESSAISSPTGSVAYAAPAALPAALRPLSLDIDDEDEGVLDALPPRHIALPSSTGLFGGQPETGVRLFDQRSEAAAPVPFAAPQVDVDEDVDAEAIAEESYSSLLDLGRPVETRSSFVRIDEPEQDSATVEPVVIFPGQSLRQPALQAESPMPRFGMPEPVSDGSTAENQVRRFDSPTASVSGAPVFAASVQPQQDAAVTEQALRSALANLQRMSGAA